MVQTPTVCSPRPCVVIKVKKSYMQSRKLGSDNSCGKNLFQSDKIER